MNLVLGGRRGGESSEVGSDDVGSWWKRPSSDVICWHCFNLDKKKELCAGVSKLFLSAKHVPPLLKGLYWKERAVSKFFYCKKFFIQTELHFLFNVNFYFTPLLLYIVRVCLMETSSSPSSFVSTHQNFVSSKSFIFGKGKIHCIWISKNKAKFVKYINIGNLPNQKPNCTLKATSD